MAYDFILNLPHGWCSEMDTYIDESGAEVTHLEAQKKSINGLIDIYVGETPEDETPEDQAWANYAETVGFDEDDPEDYNPIFKIKFNGRNAWGFDAMCEGDSPMRFLCQEVRNEILEEVHQLVERNFRVKNQVQTAE